MGFWEDFRRRYAIRAPVEELRERARSTELKRTLGAAQVTALGVGAIVGAGIFTVIGVVAADYAGPAVVISFAVAAVVSLLVALAYAELSTMIPLGGSAYTYASAAMGELVGWIVAWALLVSYGVGNAAIATGFSANLTGLLGGFGYALPAAFTRPPEAGGIADLPALAIVVLVTVLLLRPVKESASFNTFLVVVKIGTLLLFAVLGWNAVRAENWVPFAPQGVSGIMAGAGIGFFVFLGFDAVSTAAEETKNPKRDLPLGILGSLAVVVVLYGVVALVLTGIVPSSSLDTGEPLAFALRQAGFGWAGAVLNVGGLLATLSVLLVFQLATTRVLLSVSRDGLLPQGLATVDRRHGTPNRITLLLGAIVGLSAAFVPLDLLVALTNEATLFFFAVVCLAVVVLRRTAPDVPRPFLCPWSPWLPLAGAAACLYLAYLLGWAIHFTFLAWVGLGLMLYAAYGVRNSVLRKRMEGAERTQ